MDIYYSELSQCERYSFKNAHNGRFLIANQSMFTEIEVANQWHCRAHNNLCPTLHIRTCVLFVCDQACGNE